MTKRTQFSALALLKRRFAPKNEPKRTQPNPTTTRHGLHARCGMAKSAEGGRGHVQCWAFPQNVAALGLRIQQVNTQSVQANWRACAIRARHGLDTPAGQLALSATHVTRGSAADSSANRVRMWSASALGYAASAEKSRAGRSPRNATLRRKALWVIEEA